MLQPRIEILNEKKLVGIKMSMSVAKNRTHELWSSFMPRRNEIKNSILTPVYSVQIYPPSYFENFVPGNLFEKWAAVEVRDVDTIPEQMEVFSLPKGLHAVFDYKGLSTNSDIFQYIFSTWLPALEYRLDNRPHFEVLGQKYKNNDPNSKEEIWIPIRPKQ